MVGILVSFWDGLFSGAMLVSGRVTLLLYNLLLSSSALATKCNKSIGLSNYPLFERQIRLTRLGISDTLHFRHHGSCTIGTGRLFVCILYTYYIPEILYANSKGHIWKELPFPNHRCWYPCFFVLGCISFYKWIFQWYFSPYFSEPSQDQRVSENMLPQRKRTRKILENVGEISSLP